jgi:hypothetical protein
MKKIVIILLFIITSSCSVSDDTPRSHDEFLPIESVSMPDSLLRNQTYTIHLTYNKPSTCHLFKDIYYVVNANDITVAIISEVYPASSDCQEISTEAEASFNFRPDTIGTYTFKFWEGNDNSGLDHYNVIEIEVVE